MRSMLAMAFAMHCSPATTQTPQPIPTPVASASSVDPPADASEPTAAASNDSVLLAYAVNNLSAMGRNMQEAYERETLSSDMLTMDASTGVTHTICPSAKPIPANIDAVSDGRAYQSSAKEWSDDPGWRCLKFTIDDKQTWQFEVRTDARGTVAYARRRAGNQTIELRIRGTVDTKTPSLRMSKVEGL